MPDPIKSPPVPVQSLSTMPANTGASTQNISTGQPNANFGGKVVSFSKGGFEKLHSALTSLGEKLGQALSGGVKLANKSVAVLKENASNLLDSLKSAPSKLGDFFLDKLFGNQFTSRAEDAYSDNNADFLDILNKTPGK